MRLITFSKPNIDKLKNEGYNPIDMHVHTKASNDCSVSVQSVLKKAKKIGIGVAITDHDKIDSAVAALDNNLGVLIIPGIEVWTKDDRHVLFYFYDKKELIRFYDNEVKNKFLSKTIKDIINLKNKYRCILGIPHPSGYRIWENFSIDYNISKIDFLEVLNGECSQKRAVKAYHWAIKYKKGICGGSDAHELSNLGRCVMCSKGKTIKEVLESIKKNETSVIGLPWATKERLRGLHIEFLNFGIWILSRVYSDTGMKRFVKTYFKKAKKK